MRPNGVSGLVTALLCCCVGLTAAAQGVRPPQPISFAPLATNADFASLFTSSGPWQVALAQISEFEVTTYTLSQETDQQVGNQIAFLRAHNIQLGVIIPVQPSMVAATACKHPEALVTQSLLLGQRLKALNAPVGRVLWDEPLAYGHYGNYITTPPACQYSIDQLAWLTSQVTQAFRWSYPQAKITQIEPVCGLNYQGSLLHGYCVPPSVADLDRWLDDLRGALGDGPVDVRIDVQWHRIGWQAAAQIVVPALRQRGMDYGAYVDAIGPTTDAGWIATAKANFLAWTKLFPNDPPSEVAVSSWYVNPIHLLPETNPGTLTALLDWYCAMVPAIGGGCEPAARSWQEAQFATSAHF